MSSPPGWYPDPRNPGHIRYWDGSVWTEHTAAQPPAPGSQVAFGAPPAPSAQQGMPWWQTWFAIVPGLVLCLPVGLVWLWRRPSTSAQVKWIVTGCTVALLAAVLLIPTEEDQAPRGSDEPSASPTPAEETTAAVAPSPTVEEAPVATVPAMRGLSLAEAKRQLRRSGLVLGEVLRQPSAKAAGLVLRQGTPRGSELEPGTPVALVVTAPFPRVPAVVGRGRDAAVKAIRSAGFEVETTTETRTSGRAGVVLSQSPAGSSRVRPGSVVRLVISKVVPTLSGGGGGGGSGCTPGYSPCLTPASDYDCAGGSGNGPEYVYGVVQVNGPDIYDLDRDGDGLGCD